MTSETKREIVGILLNGLELLRPHIVEPWLDTYLGVISSWEKGEMTTEEVGVFSFNEFKFHSETDDYYAAANAISDAFDVIIFEFHMPEYEADVISCAYACLMRARWVIGIDTDKLDILKRELYKLLDSE